MHSTVFDARALAAETLHNIAVHLAVVQAVPGVLKRMREVLGPNGAVDPRIHQAGVEGIALKGLILQGFHYGRNNTSVRPPLLLVERVDTHAVEYAVTSGMGEDHVLFVSGDDHWAAAATEGASIADVAQKRSISRAVLVSEHLCAAAETVERHACGKRFRCDDLAVELNGCRSIDSIRTHREELHEESLSEVGLVAEAFVAVEPCEGPVAGSGDLEHEAGWAAATARYESRAANLCVHEYLPGE